MIQGTEIKEPVSVGQEFIEWAEQYWHLDKIAALNTDVFNGEKSDYKYMRIIFIQKINAIISDRLGN
jgi:hypothetical protein